MQRTKDMNLLGKHGYDESAINNASHYRGRITSFSVGVFPWVSAAVGLKSGKAVVRVVGDPGRAEVVRQKCEEVRLALDAGTYVGPKTIHV